MANSFKWEVHYIAPPLLILFLSFFNFADAQNLKKYYTSLSQPTGVLYHVFTYADYNSKDNNSLEFDITYLSSSDSVVLNYTVLSSTPLQIKSISLGKSYDINEIASKRLFIDNFKGKWRCRYSSTISKFHFMKILESESPLDFIVNSEINIYTFPLKGKVWNKHRLILNQIFQTIMLNE